MVAQISATDNNTDLKPIFEPAAALMKDLDVFFADYINQFPPELKDYVQYVISNKGKRVRPLLVFLSGMVHDNPLSDALKADLVKAAAIVELIHIATLVHDDVIDEANMRHSNLTAGVKYSPKEAILLGDALFSHGLVLASEFSNTDICQAVAKATCNVCAGEIKQTLRHRLNAPYTREDYYRVVELKTSALFHLSCFLGSTVAGSSQDYINGVGCFANHLGRAYQIYDDMLDLFGSQDKEGKTLGTDADTEKLTLPVIYLIEQVGDPEAIAQLPQEALLAKISEHQITEKVLSAFSQELTDARQAIEPFKDSPSIDHLNGLLAVIQARMNALF